MENKKNVLVCGGGNAAHVLLALAGHKSYKVNVLTTYGDEAKRWEAAHKINGGTKATICGTEHILTGVANRISNSPADVVPGCDLIVFAMPAFAHESYLHAIKPYIGKECNNRVTLGALPGEGGFDLCVRDVFGKQFDDLNVFALETLPWACRLSDYGKSVDVLGTKKDVDIGVTPTKSKDEVISVLEDIFFQGPKLHFVGNILNCTIMNINSVWHPTITYGRYRDWDFKTPFDEKPLFYEGVDDFTADKLTQVSNEILKLKEFLENEKGLKLPAVRHVKEWMYRSYHGDMTDETNLRTMINTNKGYQGLTHPMVETDDGKYLPNFNYRYMSEDVPAGLMVTRGLFELCGLECPAMDEVLQFGQKALGKSILVDGKIAGPDVNITRTPQKYGYKTIDELIEKCRYKE